MESLGTIEMYQGMIARRNDSYTKEDLYWGTSTYIGLKLFLEHLARDEVYYDIKPFHLLYEHKHCMFIKVDYLRKMGYLPYSTPLCDEFQGAVDAAAAARNLMLKYHATNNIDILKKNENQLLVIQSKEYEALKKLLLLI